MEKKIKKTTKPDIKNLEARIKHLEWWIDHIAKEFNLYDIPENPNNKSNSR